MTSFRRDRRRRPPVPGAGGSLLASAADTDDAFSHSATPQLVIASPGTCPTRSTRPSTSSTASTTSLR